MKVSTLFYPVLLAASLATASLATAQQSPPPPPPQGEHDHGPEHDHRMHEHMALSEAQQDKLFALRHAAEPAEREHEKAGRHAHEALRELAESGNFTEAKAASLAQALGQAVAAEALDRAREQAQFLSVLTPEQRTKMQQEKMQHGHGHGEPDSGKQP
jgi:protein CpxP